MFTVVICTMSNVDLLKKIIDIFIKESLIEQIIIINNNSSDDTLSYLNGLKTQKLLVVTNNFNNGVIKARNQGIALSTSKFTLILDDDQIPSRDTIIRYKSALKSFDIVGCETQIMDMNTGLTKVGTEQDFTYIGAGGMCMRTDLWRKLGLFDEIFSPSYFEDPDVCLKAVRKGYKLGYVNNHGITHICHSTLSKGARNLGFDPERVMLRNRKIFLGRYSNRPKVNEIRNDDKTIKILYVLRNINVGGVQKNTLDLVSNLPKDRYKTAIYVADSTKEGDLSDKVSQYSKIYYNRSVEMSNEVKVYRNMASQAQVIFDKYSNTELIKPGSEVTDDRFPNVGRIPSFRLVDVQKRSKMEVEDAVKIFNPDIVHYQRDLTNISKKLLKLKDEIGFRICRTVHSATNPTSIKGYDKIIFLTRSGLSKMVKNHKGVKARLIRNGIDIKLFSPSKINVKPIIFTHTRLAKLIKMTAYRDLYFEVVRSVLEKTNFTHNFVVMGADKKKYYAELMYYAKKHSISNNFIIEDALYGKDLVEYINSCSVWFYPMHKDCFPISVLEAMSCGVPIVASSINGISEMITNGTHGLLCDSSDKEMFASNIIKILNDSDLRDCLGKNARTKAVKQFSLDNMINKFDELYKTLGG